MNMNNVKNIFAAAVLLGLVGHTDLAAAKSLKGALGASRSATDVYRVTCSKNANGDTANLKVALLDLAPVAAPMISVQVIKGILAKNTTDAVDGDTTSSPNAIISGGNGSYDVRVNKTSNGGEKYQLNYTCLNSKGKVTGTTFVSVQNQ
jgi:hypothetical protein